MTSKTPTVKSNELNEQCYCIKPRNFDDVELQCCVCATWYHVACIDLDVGPLVRFMINYQFFCKKCGSNNQESFVKKQASFHQLCLTTLANLTVDHRNDQPPKQFFSKEKDVIPFIERNWESMTNAPRRIKSTWHATVSRSLTREDVFMTKCENSEILHGLRDLSMEKIGPYNENLKLILGTSRLNNEIRQNSNDPVGLSSSKANSSGSNGAASSGSSSKRGPKRKASDNYSNYNQSASGGTGAGSSYGSGSSGSRRRGLNDLSRLEKMVPQVYPLDHPFNKDGYRYFLVEPDPHSPMKQKFEETELWAGKPLPGHLYRLFLENKVALALHDRAPQLKLSEDRMCVLGEKGYSMVRATHGVQYGSWYFEVTVRDKPTLAAFRIGWAQQLANLQAPCGFDKFSYSWRSRKGTVFHESIGKRYSKLVETNENGDAGYGTGDVLGFYINLPLEDNHQLLPESCKQMTLVKFKNHLYYEERDNFKDAEKTLKPLKGSQIAFFKNGKCHGIAFSDIYAGVYYPAVSIYKNASVTMNFGPNFKYPPNDAQFECKPISDLATEKFVEHSLSDLVYHVVHEPDYDIN